MPKEYNLEMSKPKGAAIKLFGKAIPFAAAAAAVSSPSSSGNNGGASSGATANDDESQAHQQDGGSRGDSLPKDDKNGDVELKEVEMDVSEGRPTESKQEGVSAPSVNSVECSNSDNASVINEDLKTLSVDKDGSHGRVSKPEEEQSETSTSQGKTLKKPDKILPCPRCNSMDTKFCYYNNYNVNQPRHFCKNCQRYWTAGGTLRNVPIGAGRRKNKNSASQCRHISVTESLHNAQNNIANGFHHPSPKTNGTVLTFGSDSPLCESMATSLSLADKSMRSFARNGFHIPEEMRIPASHRGGYSSGEPSKSSSETASSSKQKKGKTAPQDLMMQTGQGVLHPIPCLPGAPWPYTWNSGQWTPPLAPTAFCPPGYPTPIYPAAPYWTYSVPPAWNAPWVPQQPFPTSAASGSGPNSPTLGKHSRDENGSKLADSEGDASTKENSTERNIWVPKTLRIDDPAEAAKSSIWTTLGIKDDKTNPIGDGGLFKDFQSKSDEKNLLSETSLVLQANPAALSRSLNFHESS